MCTFWSFLGRHYYTLHRWSLKLDHHSYFDTTNHNSKFRRLVTWSRCVPNMWGWDFTCKSICALFEGLRSLISTHFITEASNLTTILTLTVPIIILSFVDWWRRRVVFLTCEGEILLVSRYVHFLKVYVDVITTHFITEASNLTTILTLTILIIILSFVDWWRRRVVFLTCEG